MRKLGAILGLVLLAAAGPVDPAATPISRADLPWWHTRFNAKQAELRRDHPDLLLLGDSIFQNWEKTGPEAWRDFQPGWQRFYAPRNAVDLGFKGDTTANLLWRLEHGELDGIAPRAAILLIGANNFGHVHWDAAQTVAGIGAVIDAIHRHQPRMPIVLLSILPSERNAFVSRNTVAANRALAARYAGGADKLVHWVDLDPVFAPGGQFQRALFLDPLLTPPDPPLHPTADGQSRMAAAIEPTLDRLIGPLPAAR